MQKHKLCSVACIGVLQLCLGLVFIPMCRGASDVQAVPDSLPLNERFVHWLNQNNTWGTGSPIVRRQGPWVDQRIADGDDFSILYGSGALNSGRVTLLEVHYNQMYVFEYSALQSSRANIKPTQYRTFSSPASGVRSSPLEAKVLDVTLDGQPPYDVTKPLTGEITYDIPDGLRPSPPVLDPSGQPLEIPDVLMHLQFCTNGPTENAFSNAFDYFEEMDIHKATNRFVLPRPGKATFHFHFSIQSDNQRTGPLTLYFDIARQRTNPISNTIAQLVDVTVPPPTPAQLAEREAAKPQNVDLNNKPRLAKGVRTLQNSIGMQFIEIKPGSFVMGTPRNEAGRNVDEVQHIVTLSKGFMMATHLVTVGQFKRFADATGYQTQAETDGGTYYVKDPMNIGATLKNPEINWRTPGFVQTDDHPVVCMSWNDAQAFADWLSKKEGKPYRLPTEAECEGACRAGTNTVYFWGNDPDGGEGYCNAADVSYEKQFPGEVTFTTFDWNDGFAFTSPVGKFRPNAWGLYDMVGNAREWCDDWFGDYPRGPVTDPFNERDMPSRILRGGSWANGTRSCRSGYRAIDGPYSRFADYGFRLVLDFVARKIDPIATATHEIEMYPRSPDAWCNRASAEADAGATGAAVADFNQALELNPISRDALIQRGLIRQARGDLPGGLVDLKAYCKSQSPNDPIGCYGYLWVWMVQAQLGQKDQADALLMAYYKENDRSPLVSSWSKQIAGFFLGQIIEPDFLATAKASEPSLRKGTLCEAWYYAGKKRLIAGDVKTAAEYFQKCMATGRQTFYEYRCAALELKTMGK